LGARLRPFVLWGFPAAVLATIEALEGVDTDEDHPTISICAFAFTFLSVRHP